MFSKENIEGADYLIFNCFPVFKLGSEEANVLVLTKDGKELSIKIDEILRLPSNFEYEYYD